MDPLISVILTVYNQENYLEETITSILNQSFSNFELLILDDGSTDNSAQIIREFADRYSCIQAFFEPNTGKSKATNYLVKKAKGKWCAFLDADDIMLPERLESQVAFHNSNSTIDASSSHCYYVNEVGNVYGIQRYDQPKTIEECAATIANEDFISCSYTAMMVSKEVYLNAGGLDSRFEPCEDFEFVNRLLSKKYILLINPVVLMKYRIHPSAVTVKKPMLIFDTISYVKYCFQLRKENKPEISFADFNNIQNTSSWWVKVNRKRINYSRIFFRNAGFAMLSKNYLSFSWQIATSLVLSPDYVIKKMTNFSKKME